MARNPCFNLLLVVTLVDSLTQVQTLTHNGGREHTLSLPASHQPRPSMPYLSPTLSHPFGALGLRGGEMCIKESREPITQQLRGSSSLHWQIQSDDVVKAPIHILGAGLKSGGGAVPEKNAW